MLIGQVIIRNIQIFSYVFNICKFLYRKSTFCNNFNTQNINFIRIQTKFLSNIHTNLL